MPLLIVEAWLKGWLKDGLVRPASNTPMRTWTLDKVNQYLPVIGVLCDRPSCGGKRAVGDTFCRTVKCEAARLERVRRDRRTGAPAREIPHVPSIEDGICFISGKSVFEREATDEQSE